MIERQKRAAQRLRCLHDLLEQDELNVQASMLSGNPQRTNVAGEIGKRLAERLASRKPFRSPGKDLLADYRSME